MDAELTYLAWTLVLALVQLLAAASVFVTTMGLAYGASSREGPAPRQLGPLGGRLDRAFRNLLETLPIAAAAILIAHVAGRHNALTGWGAALYFWGRLAFALVYAAGVPYLRTLVWNISILGIVLVIAGLFGG